MKKYLGTVALFLLIFAFIVFLNDYPTYYAAQKVPSGFVYSGHAAWFDPWDLNVYLSTIRSGQKNGILLKNLYTTSYQKPIVMYPVYTALGTLFPKGDIFKLYYGFQFITIFLVMICVMYSSYVFLKSIKLSFAIAILVALSRGYGWMFINIFQSPDLFMTGFSFRSAFQRPHEGIGVVLYILAFTFLYLFFVTNKWKNFLLSLLFNIALIFFYPYYYTNYLLIFALSILFIKKTLNKASAFVLSAIVLGVISLIYYLIISHSGFASDLAEKQPIISPLGLLSGYGICLPIFIYQFFSLKNNRKNHPLNFLLLWVLISLILSYVPLGYNRFFLRGLYFPIIMISLIFIRSLIRNKKLSISVLCILAGVYIISIIPSSFYIFYKRVNEANLFGNINGWYYLPKDYFEAFKVLNMAPNDGVLSDYWVGNHIPVYTDKSVYLGHMIQTPDAPKRKEYMKDIFSNKYEPKIAKKFFIDNNINYIFYGLQEKVYGKINYDFIQPIYTTDKVTIFKFIK